MLCVRHIVLCVAYSAVGLAYTVVCGIVLCVAYSCGVSIVLCVAYSTVGVAYSAVWVAYSGEVRHGAGEACDQ